MATIKTLASALYDAFETATRDNGQTFHKLKADAPEWMTDAVHAAHGDMMPDDWRYQAIRAAALDMADLSDDDDPDDLAHERCDGLTDIYTADLTAWLASATARREYCDDAVSEGLIVADDDIIKRLQVGQFCERLEIWNQLLSFFRDLTDTCDCDDRSWHGAQHDSACPLAGLDREAAD